MRKFLLFLSVSIAAFNHYAKAQCFPEQLYDKIISGYHGSIALLHDGSYQCWGENLDSTGGGNQGSPVTINVTNYPRLTGLPLKAAVGGRGSTLDQYFLLTTTHLYAWGPKGNVLNAALTPGNTFQKVTAGSFTNADSTGLPAIGGPAHVTMMFATCHTLAIVTDSGFVYVITQADLNLQGDGSGTLTSTTWHKVKINSTTYLTGVTSVRGEVTGAGNGAMMATTASGNVYVWGPSVYLGDGTYAKAKNYATQMTLPSEFNTTNIPFMIGVSGGTSNTYTSGGGAIAPATNDTNSFYVLSASGNLYSLGYNADRQLGDFTTITRTTWVHAKKTATENFTDVNYFSVQESDNTFPAVAVVSDSDNILFCWGYSSYNMLGTSVDSATNPHVAEGFSPGGDIALFPEVGGHTLVYLKDGSSQFCYIGHKINGSMGDGVITGMSVPSFDCSGTPTVWVCGSVPVAGNDTNSVISASASNIVADGIATSAITLQLKSSVSQGDTNLTTTGGLVTMSATHGSLSAVTDNNNGTYTAILTSTVTATPAVISFSLLGATDVLNTCTVNFTPCAVNGPSSVYIGNTINLTDTTVGGTWTSSNIACATAGSATGVVTGTGIGSATITYTAGGYSFTYSVSVSIAPVTGPATDTAGQTVTLADASAGGTWSTSNSAIATIGSSGVMSGVAAGTAVITYTLGGNYVTYPVTINAMLPITGPTSLYAGNTITLADASSGGAWSSGNTSIATIGTSGIVSGVSAGIVTLTYSKGSANVTYAVTVNSLSPITGPSSEYVGYYMTLSDASGGGSWISSNSAVAAVGVSGVVHGISGGAATITYAIGSAYVTYAVTINPLQPVTGPNSVYTGNTITLADATGGGTWTSSNIFIATVGTAGAVTGIASGSVNITYTVGSVYVTYSVAVSLAPITGPDSVYKGNTITLADASAGGIWTSSNILIATVGLTGIVYGVSTGTATITYTLGTNYSTYTISVNQVSPISGPTTVYASGNITLLNIIPGGTWSSSNTGIATIGTSGIASGISCGAVTITYSIGLAYVTYGVTVNLAPVTGLSTDTAGQVITLADASAGGTWSSSNTAVATMGSTGVLTGVAAGNATITYTLGGSYVTYPVTVNAMLPISGPSSVYVSSTITLADASSGGTWSSSNAGVATIGSTGVVTGIRGGAVTITYTKGSAYVTYGVTVNLAPVSGPVSDTAGQVITLADASAGGTWSSSNTAVATIDTTGVMTGVASGNATITYTLGGSYVTYPVTVNAMLPISGPATVYASSTISLADASAGGTWSSSNAGVATIGSTGVVTGISGGTATITYTKGSAYVTYGVTVNLAPVTGPVSDTAGQVITLADASAGGTWSSSNTAVATIDTSGVMTGVASGNVTITYTLGGSYVTYPVTVNAMLPISGPTSLYASSTITLGAPSEGGAWSSSNPDVATIGSTGVVTGVTSGSVIITYSKGVAYLPYGITVNIAPITGPSLDTAGQLINLADLSEGGTWSSSNIAIATIDTYGIVSGISAGNVTITYTLGGSFVTYPVTVNAMLPVTGLTSVYVGNTISLSDASAGGTWSSNNTSIATIATSGIVSGIAAGATTLTYTENSAYVIYGVTVNALPPVSGPVNVYTGNTITLSDAASGGSWFSSNPGIATIGSTGIVSGISAGVITVTYTLGGAYVTSFITVNPIPPITGPVSVNVGSTITLADLAPGGTWSSSNTSLATIGTSGIVTGVGSGNVTITYSINGNYVTTTVSVNLTSFSGMLTACPGSTTILGYSPSGGTWSSANPGVASIGSSSGIVTGVAAGTVTISYTYSGTTVTGILTVNSLPVVSPVSGSGGLCLGSTATLTNATGGGTWISGSSIVTVGSSGVVTGMGIGIANITYSLTDINGCTGRATKTVAVTGLPGYLYTGVGTGVNSSTGDGGPAYLATVKAPRALSTDTAGNVYISDVTTNTIRKISTNGYISTVAGNGTAGNGGDGGPATAAQLNMSGGGGLYIDKAGNFYISNTAGQSIRKVTASTGIISTICGTNVGGFSGDGGLASAAKVQVPLGICEDTSGNIYFADASNYRIRRIDAITGIITTIIGTGSNAYSGDGGPGTSARVSVPRDVIADVYGNLYIADFGNDVIRKYVIATGIITTIAGNGTAGSGGDGGPATAAQFNSPARLAFDGSNNLYIADQANFKVRKVNLSTGIISTVIATGTAGFAGDGGPSTLGKMTQTAGIAITKNGNIYVSDMSNYRVRVSPYNGSIAITLTGPTTVVPGTPVTFTANSSISGPYVSYQWLKNGTATGSGGKTFTNFSPANGDVYRCVLQVTPECGATFYDTSNSITITLAGSRTADTTESVVKVAMEQSEVKIFPNPVHNQLNIEGTNLANGPMEITVKEMTGRLISSKTAEVTDNRLNQQMDMQSLAEGMYLVTLTDNAGNSKTIKCVKN